MTKKKLKQLVDTFNKVNAQLREVEDQIECFDVADTTTGWHAMHHFFDYDIRIKKVAKPIKIRLDRHDVIVENGIVKVGCITKTIPSALELLNKFIDLEFHSLEQFHANIRGISDGDGTLTWASAKKLQKILNKY